MNRRLKIAISQRIDRIDDRNEMRDALDCRLPQWLAWADMLAFPVPNGLSSLVGPGSWLAALAPDAIVLSGGNDIGAMPMRDATERHLLDHAAQHGLPVLGICRGMQMMGFAAGAALKPVTGHVRTRHEPLVLAEDTGGAFPASVNSYHDWNLAAVPPDYRVLARSSDGEIEAMRHETRAWEGWMWHPECEVVPVIEDIARLKALFNAVPA